nr:hypothetical protein [Tanacetum cinerariifolium]
DDDAPRVVSPSLMGMREVVIRLGKSKYETRSCSQGLFADTESERYDPKRFERD